MKVYYHFQLIENRFFNYQKSSIRHDDSAYTTLNKIEKILTHFQDYTYFGGGKVEREVLKNIAVVIVEQYREKQRNLHWLIRLIFYFCISYKTRRVNAVFERIEEIGRRPEPQGPALPPRISAQAIHLRPGLAQADSRPLIPTKAMSMRSQKMAIVPRSRSMIERRRFCFPFDKNRDAVRLTLLYLDLRALICFSVGSKYLRALALPVCKKIRFPVDDRIEALKVTCFYSLSRLLFEAAKRRDTKDLFARLLMGANPNTYKDENKDQALHWAAYLGDKGNVAILLKHGAEVDARGYLERTALFQACLRYINQERDDRYICVMQLLLKKKANPNLPCESGRLVLNLAIERNAVEVVELLLSSKADPQRIDARGNNSLHCAAAATNTTILRLLFEAGMGAKINVRGDNREMPLFFAFFGRDAARKQTMQLLLENRADPNALDAHGKDLAALAAINGREDLLKLLIDHKADINRMDLGFTTLGFACGGNQPPANHRPNVDVIDLLLREGADPGIRQLKGCLPVEIAEKRQLHEIAQRLWNKMPPLYRAIYNADTVEMRKILETNTLKKVNRPYKPLPKGETPLFFAYRVNAAAHKQSVMQLLLESKANPDLRDENQEALVDHMAYRGERDLLEMMINHNADINQIGNRYTPLGWACFKKSGSLEVVRLLLQRGANQYLLMQGETLPIALAEKNRRDDIADLLFQCMSRPVQM
jgi:ankyrin repeat protein